MPLNKCVNVLGFSFLCYSKRTSLFDSDVRSLIRISPLQFPNPFTRHPQLCNFCVGKKQFKIDINFDDCFYNKRNSKDQIRNFNQTNPENHLYSMPYFAITKPLSLSRKNSRFRFNKTLLIIHKFNTNPR